MQQHYPCTPPQKKNTPCLLLLHCEGIWESVNEYIQIDFLTGILVTDKNEEGREAELLALLAKRIC